MLGPHTVDVINPGEKSSGYGNGKTADWNAATETPVTGCSVQPVFAPKYTVDRENITTRWVAWLPAGSPVTGRSRIRWNGDTYDIEGDPQVWGFAPVEHVVINLKRSSG